MASKTVYIVRVNQIRCNGGTGNLTPWYIFSDNTTGFFGISDENPAKCTLQGREGDKIRITTKDNGQLEEFFNITMQEEIDAAAQKLVKKPETIKQTPAFDFPDLFATISPTQCKRYQVCSSTEDVKNEHNAYGKLDVARNRAFNAGCIPVLSADGLKMTWVCKFFKVCNLR